LFKRGISLDPLCIFCKSSQETICHILWDYASAMDVWGACAEKIQKSVMVGNTFVEVLEYLVE
jgi:hypothetical protein